MAVTDDIETLGTRTLLALDDLFNFGAHIHLIWRHFHLWVREGNTLKSRNSKTGTVVNEQELIQIYRRYEKDYLLRLSFVQLLTLFEAFLFDLLRLLLANEPRHLGQKKQIDVGLALSADDRPSLVLMIVDRELNELKYKRVGEWLEYLNKLVSLDRPTQDEVARLAELKAARDILVHNSGVVNGIYLEKAGAKARYSLGDTVVIDRPYFDEGWGLTRKLVGEVTEAAKRRLTNPLRTEPR